MVVGTLKPSITFGSLVSLQLAPARSSSLPLLPACCPHSQLTPLASSSLQGPRDVLGAREASWGLPEASERFQRPRNGLGAWGASCKRGEHAGGFLRLQEGSRDPGMLWEQGEQAGCKGSKLEVRGACWGLSEAPGRFQGSRDALGARGASWEQGSKLGVRGASWGLPEAPERLQGSRDALGAMGVSWGLPEAQEGSRDPGMVWEQGEEAGSKGSKLEVRGSKLEVRGTSWRLPKAPGRLQGLRDALGAMGVS